jgi:DNA repair exonuclease SbcCD ATPase subunit
MEQEAKIEDRGLRIDEDTSSRHSILHPRSSILGPQSTTESWTVALEKDLREYLMTLDALAYRLIDEQIRVINQCHRLAAARVQWESEHHARVKELEGRNLQLRKDERALEERTAKLHRHQIETNQTRQSLETWHARMTLESASWKAERERLLAQLHALETRANRLSAILAELPADWKDRLRQGDSTTMEKHRQAQAEAEYARLRQELQSLHEQRLSYEQQIADLTAMVERLAGLLMEEDSASVMPAARAA